MKMKYVLENPSFTTGPVEIDNPKAVKQIAAYVNKPIILGDEILVVVEHIPHRLKLMSMNENEYRFKNVKLRKY